MFLQFVKEMNTAFAGFLQNIFVNSGIGEASESWVGTFWKFFDDVLNALPFKF